MIFALALMVISYGVGHRLFEFSWKGMLRINHPSAMAYQVARQHLLDFADGNHCTSRRCQQA